MRLVILEKKQFLYRERQEEKRQAFLKQLEKIPVENRVYYDETGMDSNERQEYGWGLKGIRVYDEKPGFAIERLSILASLNNKKLCAPLIFEGYCTREIVEYYFEFVLLPSIGQGKTIILNNASYHKGGRIQEIVGAAGCDLLYLAPYSPDLNPIEHHWFPVKNAIRAILPDTNYQIFEAAEMSLAKLGMS